MEHVFECLTCGEVTNFTAWPNSEIKCLKCRKIKEHVADKFITEEEKVNYMEKARQTYAQCYEETMDLILKYMDIPESTAKIVALWIIGTHLHSAFTTYPFLYFTAMKGSGKTRLLKIISQLANGSKGEVHTGITESVLFRMPKHATLILDECESISNKDKGVLREYMNACYKSGGVVQRAKKVKTREGEGYEIESFQPYKPIGMANIWGMDEVLGDRSLSFILEKSNSPGKTKLMEDFSNNLIFQAIKSSLNQFQCSLCSVVTSQEDIKSWNNYVLAKYDTNIHTNTHTTYIHITTLTTQKLEMLRKIDELEIEGRNLELLFPLFIISRLLSEELFNEVCEIAKETIKQKKDDDFIESRDVSLIDFCSKERYGLNFILTNQLTRDFREYLGNTDEEDRWLNSKWLGRALKRLGLIIDKRRIAKGVEVMINQSKAKEKLMMFKT